MSADVKSYRRLTLALAALAGAASVALVGSAGWFLASAAIVGAAGPAIAHAFNFLAPSAAVRFFLGREHEGAHDALADVEATADVLLAQLERYTDLPGSVDALGEFSGDRERNPDAAGKLRFDAEGRVCLGFGKYTGWTLENIGRNDPGYLQWLMTKAELPSSTMAVMRRALENAEN